MHVKIHTEHNSGSGIAINLILDCLTLKHQQNRKLGLYFP